ncbi:MAG: tetratricopeptide repeat protein [Candidatus Kapabacteria bacterium]|nr:tetratricopeptide repeat protein [Candidatus Kapabacteria bacterium]
MSELSILFAVEADKLLQAGKPEEAIEICSRGLEIYPGYAAAISILAKAYKEIGELNKTAQLIESYKSVIPASTFLYLKESISLPFDREIQVDSVQSEEIVLDDKIEEIVEEISDVEIETSLKLDKLKSDLDIIFDTIYEELNDPEFIEQEILVSSEQSVYEELVYQQEIRDSEIESAFSEHPETTLIQELSDNLDSHIDNNRNFSADNKVENYPDREHLKSSNLDLIPGLSKFASGSTNALFYQRKPIQQGNVQKVINKQSDFMSIISSLSLAEAIKPDYETATVRNKSSVVITDTIAGILMKQGAFKEAKDAYVELSKRNPDKLDYYNQKVAEIEAKL